MKVQIVGSALDGNVHQFAATYLINDTVSIDAGCLGFASLDVQQRVRHVFLSHTHLDHIATLPIFLDNVFRPGPDCCRLYASETSLAVLKECVFNDRVWPDVFRLAADEGSDFVQPKVVTDGQPVVADGLTITPIELSHNLPTFGFIVQDTETAIAFVSDTGPTDRVWEACNGLSNLQAVFVESAFPNKMKKLAEKAHHLTPQLLLEEQKKLRADVPLFIVHIKPAFYDDVLTDLHALGLPNLEISRPDTNYEFPGHS